MDIDRAVLIYYRRDGVPRRGSGLRIAGNRVLTADHCADGTDHRVVTGGRAVDATVLVRTGGPEVDLAVLAADGLPEVDPPGFVVLDRSVVSRIADCTSLGFPVWKGTRERPLLAQASGYLPTGEDVDPSAPVGTAPLLTFKVTDPEATRHRVPPGELDHPSSEWAGMSGAAVFTAADELLGVIRSHNLSEGLRSLTVTPLDAIDGLAADLAASLWSAIGVTDRAALRPPRSGVIAPPLPPAAMTVALPARSSVFTGRADALALALEWLRSNDGARRPVLLYGGPGVGKSQLAVEIAYRLLAEAPERAWHIDLQGYSENHVAPEVTAGRLLAALAPDAPVPADPSMLLAAARELLATRRSVVVLDNAGSAVQVRELLPNAARSAIVITSRSALATLDAHLLQLEELSEHDAVGLLRAVLGEQRAAQSSEADLAVLARLCGCLPLALRIAGALLASRPAWGVQTLTDRLSDEGRRLDLLDRDDLAVRSAFESSYRTLDDADRLLFALLGGLGPLHIAAWMAAGLLDCSVGAAEDRLEELVDAQLLRPLGPDLAGDFRYGFHDLIRLYAREKLTTEVAPDVAAAASERMLSSYLSVLLGRLGAHPIAVNFELAPAVPLPWTPSGGIGLPVDPVEWLSQERSDLVATVEQASHQQQWPYVWAIADILHPLFILSRHGPESRRVKELALVAARQAQRLDVELEVRFTFVSSLHQEHRHAEAIQALVELRSIRQDLGHAVAVAHLDLMIGVMQRDSGAFVEAELSLTRSIAELAALPGGGTDPITEARTASAGHNLAIVLRERGRLAEADSLLDSASTTFSRLGDDIALGRVLHSRAVGLGEVGNLDRARQLFVRAADICRRVGDRRWTTIALLGQARLAIRRADWPAAAAMLDACYQEFERLDEVAGMAQVSRSRGIAARRQSDLAIAESHFDAADDGFVQVNDRRSLGRLALSRALLQSACGDSASAADLLRQADRLLAGPDDPVWQCRVRVAQARLAGGSTEGLLDELDRLTEIAGPGFTPEWILRIRQLDALR